METDLDMSSRDTGVTLIVGGAGYVGNVMMRQMLQAGRRVRCLDALYYDNAYSISPLMDSSNFSFVQGDIRNTAEVQAAMDGVQDVVLLAALVGDPISRKYPDLTRAVNFDGAKRVLDIANEYGVERFVFTSTCSNYGVHDAGTLATETSPLNPKSIYAETKVEFEEFILTQGATIRTTPTILRIATAFGLSSRMRFDLTVSDFTRALANGESLDVFDEHTWRPYCHILDLTRAVMMVLNAEQDLVSNAVFNVGSNTQNFTKAMIIDQICEVLPEAKNRVSFRSGSSDPRDYRVDFSKIENALGFATHHTVADAIQRLIHLHGMGAYRDMASHPEKYGNHRIHEV